MEIILTIGLIVLVALNIYASYQCYRDWTSSVGQRLAQIAFIWVVPVIGAVLAIRLIRNEPEKGTGTYQSEKTTGEEYVTGFGRQNAEGYISSPDNNFHSVDIGDSSPH
jgi:hypothetical protein